MQESGRRGALGFTIMEVLAAMSLFAIAASAVSALTTSSLRHTTRNRHGSLAAMLAQERLEELRGLAYQDILPATQTVTAAQQSYTVSTGVRDDVPALGMKQINVTVSWTGPEGAQSYAVDTIYTAVTS